MKTNRSSNLLARVGLTLALLAALMGSLPAPRARAAQAPQIDLHPLEALLNPDGTLDLTTGFSGSLDPSGWRMEVAPDGAPLFKPASAPAAPLAPANTWHALGTNPLNDDVRAIAVVGKDVYVGGNFTDAGGNENADYIARWSGLGWSALGSTPLNGAVLAIAVAGERVYAGGTFTDAGGNTSADYIACWNDTTSTWGGLYGEFAIPALNGAVHAIAVVGGDVYVGGDFTDANGLASADYIARWSNANWFSLGATPLNGFVRAIAVAGADVYVGGEFTDAGGDTDADFIARWDRSTSAWDSLGTTPLNNTVIAIAVVGPYVYAGGWFTNAGGNADADYVARMRISPLTPSWSPLGATPLNNAVHAIAVAGPNVYIGGSFTNAGGVAAADRIARWDGSAWNALGDGLGDGLNITVYAVAVAGPDVYVGGRFANAGGDAAADYIARWDAAELDPAWSALGATPLNVSVSAVAVAGPDVYVGGYFQNAGGVAAADNIARWDGSAWHALGDGLNGMVLAIAVEGPDVYAGGRFTNAGGNANANCIARWNGTFWSALGSGLNNWVHAIAVAGSDVYAGGEFTDAGGVAGVNHLARWNGSSWSGFVYQPNKTVEAIAVVGPVIYIGGWFTSVGGVPNTAYLARWNGLGWGALGGGLNGAVETIAVVGADIYVGGEFTDAGGNGNADYIARWDGSAWHALGSTPLNSTVYAIAVAGADIYVGGWFTDAGGIEGADCFACWRLGSMSSYWRDLDTGLSGGVYAIAVAGVDVYAGGDFTDAGGNAAADYIARWGTAWRVYLPLVLRN